MDDPVNLPFPNEYRMYRTSVSVSVYIREVVVSLLIFLVSFDFTVEMVEPKTVYGSLYNVDFGLIVRLHASLYLPSVEATLTVAVPIDTPLTNPVFDTVTMVESLEVYVYAFDFNSSEL